MGTRNGRSLRMSRCPKCPQFLGVLEMAMKAMFPKKNQMEKIDGSFLVSKKLRERIQDGKMGRFVMLG